MKSNINKETQNTIFIALIVSIAVSLLFFATSYYLIDVKIKDSQTRGDRIESDDISNSKIESTGPNYNSDPLELTGFEYDTETVQSRHHTLLLKTPVGISQTYVYLRRSEEDETYLATVPDLYLDHSHTVEYRFGSIYAVKRVGYDGEGDDDWTDELWKYNEEGEGELVGGEIISGITAARGKDLDYIVDENDEMIAVTAPNGWLTLYSSDGAPVRPYSDDEFVINTEIPGISFDLVSIDTKKLWISNSVNDDFVAFVSVDLEDFKEVKIYETPNLPMSEYAFDSDSLTLASSDYPRNVLEAYETNFGPDAPAEYYEWIENDPEVHLFIYNFERKEKVLVDTLKRGALENFKKFEPAWLDNGELEYNDPEGDGRITVDVSELP